MLASTRESDRPDLPQCRVRRAGAELKASRKTQSSSDQKVGPLKLRGSA
jgi:hypothetical protein